MLEESPLASRLLLGFDLSFEEVSDFVICDASAMFFKFEELLLFVAVDFESSLEIRIDLSSSEVDDFVARDAAIFCFDFEELLMFVAADLESSSIAVIVGGPDATEEDFDFNDISETVISSTDWMVCSSSLLCQDPES